HWKVEVALLGEVEELCDTPAFRVDQEFRVPVFFELPVNDVRCDPSVDMTLSRPDLHLPLGLLHNIGAQKHVWQEDNLAIPRNTIHHLHGVASGAGVVAPGLHLRRRVNVRNDDSALMSFLPSPQSVSVNSCSSGTAC